MPTDVIMPQMGESIFEGTITKWLKKVGDTVEKDEPLFEISTDKVDAEIPAPVAGVLAEIRSIEGATVEVNTVVAVIGDAGTAATPIQERAATQLPSQESQAAGTEIVMPQMGESIFEGTITKWLKKAGDPVQKDEPLLEISTDKVDAEIPSPLSGILTEIRVPEGATVEVNAVLAIIGGPAPAQSEAPDQESAPPQMANLTQTSVQRSAPPQVVQKPAAPQAAQVPQQAHGGRVRSSPLARRIAKEHGIAISQIPGSGHEGRITKDDVLRAMNEASAPSQPAANPPSGAAAAQVPAAPQTAALIPGELVPLTRMRAIIAERMVESVRIAPHVHTVYKVDMTRIAHLRDRIKAGFDQRHGVKLTWMPFIAAAAVAALRRFPIVNASLETAPQGLAIRYHQNIHLGIAVALDWGLIVPVIRNAEQRSFADLARTIADLALRARNKKLSPDEVGGSTFTLTNAGAFGGEYGMPIINQPESAILAVGGLRKEPAVLTDADGDDTIAIRSMQYFCLGFDHRLIDGADGGKFMSEFKKVLETWNQEIG
jgi:2-oxoglutarate dehydrogenase E2 component (dihydrolipoamide succinyltransferase)